MSPLAIRRIVIVVFVGGIGGMIAGSIVDNNGLAITFGLITAAAALGLILVTSVAGPKAFAGNEDPAARAPVVDESVAADVEARLQDLVAAGTDEQALRVLVARAVELGRGPG